MADYEMRIIIFLALWLFTIMKARQLIQIKRRALRRRALLQTLEAGSMRLSSAVLEYEAATLRLNTQQLIERVMLVASLRNNRCRPSVWAFPRASQWWEAIVPGFSNTEWLQNFRMSEETFTYLWHKLRARMERQDTTFRLCVSVKKRVAIALWKLATGSEYRTIGHLFGVSITTVCRCVQDFCAAAESLLVPEQIRFPDEGRFSEMSAYMENRWGLPLCVGAIDGSHIPIIAPKECHTDYFNRKEWHSIILQGVVDGGLTADQHLFNQTVSRVRVVVENAFGRLKGRWRCLLKRNDSDIALSKSMVLTCCALHNLCESHGEIFDNTLDDAVDEPAVGANHGSEEQGAHIRDAVMQYLCSNR
ncbi:uncharacterized protein KZ484_010056 [Pholidichthys leucotaenia]